MKVSKKANSVITPDAILEDRIEINDKFKQKIKENLLEIEKQTSNLTKKVNKKKKGAEL